MYSAKHIYVYLYAYIARAGATSDRQGRTVLYMPLTVSYACIVPVLDLIQLFLYLGCFRTSEGCYLCCYPTPAQARKMKNSLETIS